MPGSRAGWLGQQHAVGSASRRSCARPPSIWSLCSGSAEILRRWSARTPRMRIAWRTASTACPQPRPRGAARCQHIARIPAAQLGPWARQSGKSPSLPPQLVPGTRRQTPRGTTPSHSSAREIVESRWPQFSARRARRLSAKERRALAEALGDAAPGGKRRAARSGVPAPGWIRQSSSRGAACEKPFSTCEQACPPKLSARASRAHGWAQLRGSAPVQSWRRRGRAFPVL